MNSLAAELSQACADLASRDAAMTVTSSRQAVLKGVARIWANHLTAIAILSIDPMHARSARVLLRPLIEAWMACRYVMDDDTDRRANAYIAHELRNHRDFFKRFHDIAQRHPDEAERVVRIAGVENVAELDRRRSEIDDESRFLTEERDTPAWPNVRQLAEAVGPLAEIIYAQVYGFLLSDDVHMSARGVMIESNRPPPDFTPVLRTAVDLTRDLLAWIDEEGIA